MKPKHLITFGLAIALVILVLGFSPSEKPELPPVEEEFEEVNLGDIPSSGYASQTATAPSSDLTDFSLLIDLEDMPTDWWSAVDTSDGTKGRATKGDGTTELATDWIDFDDTGETGLVRVKWSGTLSSGGGDTVRIYPPQAANSSYAASATYGAYNAYDSNWLAYWPDGITDRTTNQIDGTAAGDATTTTSGKIGDGLSLDGTGDYVTISNSAFDLSSATDEITLVAWVKTNVSTDASIFGFRDTGSGDPIIDMQLGFDGVDQANTGRLTALIRADNGSGLTHIHGSTDLRDNAWHQTVYTVNSSKGVNTYEDGSSVASGTHAMNTSLTPDTMRIGDESLNAAIENFNGTMDELSIHAEDRSAAWIDEEFDQVDDNATFWGTWSWTAPAGGDVVQSEFWF